MRNFEKIVTKKFLIKFFIVDAHNVIPVTKLSDHQEYAARTIRIKINKALPNYLTNFPKLEKIKDNDSKNRIPDFPKNNWTGVFKRAEEIYDKNIPEINWIKPGVFHLRKYSY